ncbi:uncharacterized protein LOC119793270 [Cyprinodon tularosa]|uniref:uncharacterized protein LOC119793270 n=1 Tax=Cyprinodon tularosa TaxID=77115 RepID=UPI0018E27A12|nr:uncharacterized protein LOC119793270 [Cyprinodon tularosa]
MQFNKKILILKQGCQTGSRKGRVVAGIFSNQCTCTCSSRYNSKVSFHCFPVDSVVRRHWLSKIRRQDFSPCRETRVCSRHFLHNDLLETPRGKRCLKKGAFPVLFEWNNYSLPVPRPSVWERRPREEEAKSPAAAAPTVDCSEMVFVAPEHDCCVSPASGVMINKLVMQNKALQKQVQMLQREVQRLQLRTLFCLERFKCSDDDIRHYTRFASYRHFQYFWKLVEPAVITKMIRVTNTKSSTATSERFPTSTICCQTPSDLMLQSEVFSTYKSHSTLKAMIGIAPHGAITFVSALYAGSMNDREIFKQSGIISVLEPDMAIMVDRGFLVDNLAPCKVYRPPFRSGKRQMNPHDVLQTCPQNIAGLRIHVERCIWRVKENKFFDGVIPLAACGIIDELFNVACYLVNYQNWPLVKAWATC